MANVDETIYNIYIVNKKNTGWLRNLWISICPTVFLLVNFYKHQPDIFFLNIPFLSINVPLYHQRLFGFTTSLALPLHRQGNAPESPGNAAHSQVLWQGKTWAEETQISHVIPMELPCNYHVFPM